MKKFWYAVLNGLDDDDLGTGSFNLRVALRMSKQYVDGFVAVCNPSNGFVYCILDQRGREIDNHGNIVGWFYPSWRSL